MIKYHSKDVLERFKKHNTFEEWEKQIFVVEDNKIVFILDLEEWKYGNKVNDNR